jgi:hypothetical protein
VQQRHKDHPHAPNSTWCGGDATSRECSKEPSFSVSAPEHGSEHGQQVPQHNERACGGFVLSSAKPRWCRCSSCCRDEQCCSRQQPYARALCSATVLLHTPHTTPPGACSSGGRHRAPHAQQVRGAANVSLVARTCTQLPTRPDSRARVLQCVPECRPKALNALNTEMVSLGMHSARRSL